MREEAGASLNTRADGVATRSFVTVVPMQTRTIFCKLSTVQLSWGPGLAVVPFGENRKPEGVAWTI